MHYNEYIVSRISAVVLKWTQPGTWDVSLYFFIVIMIILAFIQTYLACDETDADFDPYVASRKPKSAITSLTRSGWICLSTERLPASQFNQKNVRDPKIFESTDMHSNVIDVYGSRDLRALRITEFTIAIYSLTLQFPNT